MKEQVERETDPVNKQIISMLEDKYIIINTMVNIINIIERDYICNQFLFWN